MDVIIIIFANLKNMISYMHSLITVEDKHFFTCGFSSFLRPFVEMEFLVVSLHQVNWNYCFSEV